mmetsp:Transcript_41294/g.119593  ORF Transcript_41294/g.119593 Transcript_41294/m.119593 type:complete len:266 (+) Transcript_41294:904-1701(+)
MFELEVPGVEGAVLVELLRAVGLADGGHDDDAAPNRYVAVDGGEDVVDVLRPADDDDQLPGGVARGGHTRLVEVVGDQANGAAVRVLRRRGEPLREAAGAPRPGVDVGRRLGEDQQLVRRLELPRRRRRQRGVPVLGPNRDDDAVLDEGLRLRHCAPVVDAEFVEVLDVDFRALVPRDEGLEDVAEHRLQCAEAEDAPHSVPREDALGDAAKGTDRDRSLRDAHLRDDRALRLPGQSGQGDDSPHGLQVSEARVVFACQDDDLVR